MKQSTKKLTALFLSMCMTASMVSVSAVSASALDGNENAAVDISGNSEFEYTGHFTGKYVSSSGDKLVTVTTEYLDGVYVTAKSGNTFLSYTPGEKSVYFIAEKGKEYELSLYESDESTAGKCTVTEKDIPRLTDGEIVDGEIADDNYISVFSYVPGETGSFSLNSFDITEPFQIGFSHGGDLDYTIGHSEGDAYDEFICTEGETYYLIYSIEEEGTGKFRVRADNANSIYLGVNKYLEDFEAGSKTFPFKAPDDMSVLFSGWFSTATDQKVTITDSENNVIAEKTLGNDYDYDRIIFDVKKGETYNVTFEYSDSVWAEFVIRQFDITSGVPFSVSSYSDVYRYVPQSDCMVSFSSQSVSCNRETYNSSFEIYKGRLLKKGETYYFRFFDKGVFTLSENPYILEEIKLGETKELSLTDDNEIPLLFKSEKDAYVHYYPSATSDEAVSGCYVTTESGEYVSVKRVNDRSEDFNIYFKAEAGKNYLFCNYIYAYIYADAADISVTLEETAPYIIEDGAFKGDLTNQSEFSVPSVYNPPYDPGNPDEYLNPEGSGAREVTEIAYGAFSFNDDLVSVEVPDTVKKISRMAFLGCDKLENVKLSDNLESIGGFAFYGNESLKKITIPDSVTSIDEEAFSGCSTMDEVKLSKNIDKISEYTFSNCQSLKEIEIPEKVTEIGNEAFYSCESLAKVTIPEGVEEIGDSAFMGCKALSEVTVPKSVTVIQANAFGYSCEYEYAMEGDEWFYKKYDGFVIRGYEGTEAERYANDNGFTFIPIISTGPTPTEYGDANGDGSVNISDATEIQMYAAGLSEFNEAQLKYADVTGDGNVNIEDVTMIQKYIAKIIRTLDR